MTKFTDVTKGSEDALKDAVNKQPVSIAVDAAGSQWQLYKSGIFNHPTCGKQLDHGVLAVGTGTLGGTAYWKVKNSWGAAWGEAGYVRLARGLAGAGGHGIMDIASTASYPTFA